MSPFVRPLVVALLAAGAGCSAKEKVGPIPWCTEPARPTTGNVTAEPPTWFGNVLPVLRARCFTCHGPGRPAPDYFPTWEDAVAMGDGLRVMITSGHMPPWPPQTCCNNYRDSRRLTDGEYEVLIGWLDSGMARGEPQDQPDPPPRVGLSRVDLEVEMPVTYAPHPPPGHTDEYRCFLADWTADRTRYVTGVDVVPGLPGMVHHAIILWASGGQVPAHEREDARDATPGFPCPGGLPSQPYQGSLGSFVPGGQARDFDDGVGFRLERGSRLIFAMHYTTFHGVVGEDRTRVRLKLDDEASRVASWVTVADPRWYSDEERGMPIPAGDPDVVHSYAYDPTAVYRPGRVLRFHAVNLHMHRRGTRGVLGILRANGSTECLLQVDPWRDGWQGTYWLAEPVVVRPGDQLSVECHWDNSADGQPMLISGERPPPRDLHWGEDEEMCAGYVLTTHP